MARTRGVGGNDKIQFDVVFNADQASINKVKSSLEGLTKIKPSNFSGTKEELNQLKNTARQVEQALGNAFNTKLNTVNIKTFQAELGKAKLSVNQIYQRFSQAGAQGQVAFSQMARSVLTTNLQLKQTSSMLQNMGTTLINTAKWGVASSIMNNFANTIQSAFTYVQSLEKSLTNIRIVTGDSLDNMREFSNQANKTAQALGRSTLDYTKAALAFYQQGLDDETVAARTETTLKAQNITGAGQQVADYLTAVWNGYKAVNSQTELFADKIAAVADSSASDLSELSIAMSKVAATANLMGVDIDSLTAQLATVIAVTRQAPESVGTAFKTIYTRINDIKTGSDEAQVSLGNYSSQMAALGFNVLDANGKLRDTGQVIEQVGSRWQSLTKEQQVYLARTMAGQRQITQISALFENWSMYSDLLNISLDSQGTIAEKNSRYMESLGAKMEQLQAAGEKVKTSLIDADDMSALVGAAANLVDVFGTLLQSIGGGKTALLGLSAVATRVFSGVIAKQINSVITNFQTAHNNAEKLRQDIQMTQLLGKTKGYQEGVINEMVDAKRQMQDYYSVMSSQQINSYNEIVKQIGATKEHILGLQEQVKLAREFSQTLEQAAEQGGTDLSSEIVTITDYAEQLGRTLKSLSGKNALKLFNDTDRDVFGNLIEQVDQLENELGRDAIPAFEAFDNAIKNVLQSETVTDKMLITVRNTAQDVFNQVYSKNGMVLALNDTTRQVDLAKEKLRIYQQEQKRAVEASAQLFRVETITNFISSLGQLVFPLTSIYNLVKTLKDDNLSAGEKLERLFTNLAMTAPMVVSGVQGVVKTWGKLSKEAIKAAEAILEKTAAEEADALAVKWLTLGEEDEAAAKALVTKANTGVATTGAAVTATEGAETTSTLSLSAAFEVLAGNIWAALAPALPFIAAGAALVATGVALYKWWNKDAEAAQKAAEAAEEAKQQYKGTKQANEELKSSLSGYHDAVDAMKDLTKGTLQWSDALQNANDKILQLLERFPELAQYISNTDDGLLTLSEQGENVFRKNLQIGTQATGYGYMAAQSASVEAERKSLITNASRTMGDQINAKELTKVIDAVEQYGTYVVGSNDALEQLAGLDENQIAALHEHQDTLNNLITKLQNNSLALDTLKTSITNNILANEQAYKNSNNPQVFTKLVSQALEDVTLPDPTKYGGSYLMDIPDQLAKRYQEITGQQTETTTFGKFKVNGEKVDTKEIYRVVALADALEDMDATYEEITEKMRNIENTFGESADAAYQLLNGLDSLKAGDLSKQDIDNFKEHLEYIADLTQTSKQVVEKTLNDLSDANDEAINEIRKDIDNSDIKRLFNDLVENGAFSPKNAAQILSKLKESYDSQGSQAAKNLTEFYKNIGEKGLEGLDAVSTDFDFNTGTANQFRAALHQVGVQTKATDDQIYAYINALKAQQEVLSPQETYKNIHDIIDKLSDDGIVTAEDAQKLEQAGLALDGFFTHLADGSLKLEASIKDFYDYANNISLAGLKKEFEQLLNTSIPNLQTFNNSAYSKNSGGDFNTFSSSAYNPFINENDDQKLQAQLQFLTAIGQAQGHVADIQEKINDGLALSKEDYDYISKEIQQHEIEWNNVKSTLDENIKRVGVLNEELYNANQTSREKTLDEDVDVDTYKDLTKYLEEYGSTLQGVSEQVENNSELAGDLAESILRFDSALEQLLDKGDDWEDMLKSNSIQEMTQAGNELQNVYSDLLDLPTDQLSPDFTQSIDNFNLLKQAANGSEQAYNSLRQAAMQDILTRVGIDDASLAKFDTDLATIESQIQNGIDDLEIGAYIDDTQAIQAMNQLINAADMTAEQATALLADMGVDAEVESAEVPEQQKQAFVDAVPTITHQKVSIPNIVGTEDSTTVAPTTVQVPTIRYRGVADDVTASGFKTVSALRVTSARKKSGGGFKFKQSSHGGGSRGRSGGGKGKGGGGGGSSKASTIDQQQKPDNRYHDVNIRLGKIGRNLEKVRKEREKLTGPKRIKNLEKELKLLEQQAKTEKQKLKIQQGERRELAQSLKAQSKALLGTQIQFDSSNQIKNYAKVINQAWQAVENARVKFNASQSEADKTAYEELKKKYEKLVETMEKYDTLLNESIEDTKKTLADIADEKVELQIEKFKVKIDATIDWSEAYQSYREFYKEIIKNIDQDDILGQAKANIDDLFAYFRVTSVKGTKGVPFISKLTKQIKDTITEIKRMEKGKKSSIYGTDLASAYKDLKDYQSRLMDALEDIKDKEKEVQEAFFDMTDAAQQAFDMQSDEYEAIGKLIQHDIKLIELLYGEKAYDNLVKYHEEQYKYDKQQLQFQRMQRDFWYDQMQASKQRLESMKKSDDGYAEEERRFKQLEENWLSAVESFNSKVESSIENLLTLYQTRISQIFNDMGEKLFGAGGLEAAEEEWELINKQADKYLDTINSMAQIQKFKDSVKEALDNNKNNVQAQKALNNLLNDQLSYLKEKEKLSQYDIDRANALLQIELKRLALENARQNKSKLRLRRDSQGNYSYQFTADQAQTENAAAAYSQAQVDLYNLDKNRYKDSLQEIYSLYDEYAEKIQELYKEFPDETQERLRRQKELTEHYTSLIEASIRDTQEARNNLLESAKDAADELLSDTELNFETMLEGISLDTDDAIKHFVEINVPEMTSAIAQMAEAFGGNGKESLASMLQSALKKMKNASKDYTDKLKEIETISDTSFSDIANGIDPTITKTDELLQKNKTLFNFWNKNMGTITNLIQRLRKLRSVYNSVAKAAQKAATAAQKMIETDARRTSGTKAKDSDIDLRAHADKPTRKKKTPETPTVPVVESTVELQLVDETSMGSIRDIIKSYGRAQVVHRGKMPEEWTQEQLNEEGIKPGTVIDFLNGNGHIGKNGHLLYFETPSGAIGKWDLLTGQVTREDFNQERYKRKADASKYPHIWEEYKRALHIHGVEGYDTGGYTGNWNNKEGKLAVLHEKEIVLNKKDTENLLSAINVVRQMGSLLQGISDNATLSTLLPQKASTSHSVIDQNVHITASFPAVNSRVEIENALNNLVNRASQYAYSTKK